MSIPRSSWGVSIETVSAEQTIGRVLSTAVGWGPSAFINWATAEIPKYVEGIDKEADPFLEELIRALENLAEGWKHKAEPEPEQLGEALQLLEQLSNHHDRANLLYPQIMQAKPHSTSTTVQQEEEKEIGAKKAQVREKAEGIRTALVLPLIESLKNFVSPTISHQRNAGDSLLLIGELTGALKEIAHEQRSVVSKIMHTITTIATKAFKEQWQGSKNQRVKPLTLNSHPLLRLLSVIGHYNLERIYLQSDKTRAIDEALRLLDMQCPAFRGIYAQIMPRWKGNLEGLHTQVTTFIRESVISSLEMNDRAEVYIQIANFALRRREELIQQTIQAAKIEKDAAFQKSNEALQVRYKAIDDSWGLPGNKSQQKDQAFNEEDQKLQQKLKQIDQKCGEKCQRIQNHEFWNSLEKKQDWGQAFFEGRFKNIPKDFFDEITKEEILWKAVAFQQQKAEWNALKRQLDDEVEKKPASIISALDLAVDYLERFASIQEGFEKEAKQQAVQSALAYVLGWMDFAKIQMEGFEKDTWKRNEIETAFNEALQGIRKGEIVESIRSIQNFVRESDYWKRIWSGNLSPLESLSDPFKEFCSNLPPPKPPKSEGIVRELLGGKEGEWDPKWLPEANQIEKQQVLENALAFGCFEFVAYAIRLNGDKAGYYKRLMQALDELKSDEPSEEALQQILGRFLNRAFDALQDQKGISAIQNCLRTWNGNKAQLHKHLYLELINILIREKGGQSPRAWASWALYSSLYDLMDLFIQPFTKRLFERIDDLFKTNPGNLGEKHLTPIVGITKAFSTYMRAMESWESEIENQRATPGNTLSGTKDDLRVLLNRADRYEGMTPAQITTRIGYALVDQIRLPDYSQKIAELIAKIKGIALTKRVQNKYANLPIVGAQLLLASPLYLGFHAMYYVVKVLTTSINLGMQQAGKIYLWKTNIVGQMLDEALESVFIDTESAPILDTLLLEQLEDLLAELEKGTPPESSTTDAGDDRNKKVISEAIQHLFEVIRIDKYESLEAFRTRSDLPQAKKVAYGQLKKLLTTVLVSTSKSLLQKEQVDALLFELFRIANEGLRGGKSVVLTQEQKDLLQSKLNHEPSEEEIQQEGARIVRENVDKIPKVLAQIREKAINPAVDKAIDDGVQTDSQLLLDYTTWLQSRLFTPAEAGQSRNIIQFLDSKLQTEISSDTLREIHTVYALFVQEMTEFQTKLDARPSPHSLELNVFISEALTQPIQELTCALTAFIKNPQEGSRACLEKLEPLKQIQINGPGVLNRIEKAEKKRVLGNQAGLVGFVRKTLAESFIPLKEQGKQLAHGIVEWETDNKVDELRAMYKNKILVKHMLLWQMRLYLNPELANGS